MSNITNVIYGLATTATTTTTAAILTALPSVAAIQLARKRKFAGLQRRSSSCMKETFPASLLCRLV